MNVSQLRPSDAGSEAAARGNTRIVQKHTGVSSAEIQELEVRLLEKEKENEQLRAKFR